MCELNRNQLLDLFFHELSPNRERKIKHHVNHCEECRDYLILLQKTDLRFQQLSEQKPLPDTFDEIMKKIETQPEHLPARKSSFPLFPMLWIPLSALAILVLIIVVKNEIITLPIWHTIENIWVVRQLGPFGVTVFLALLVGIAITLILTPILIFESGKKQYRYNLK